MSFRLKAICRVCDQTLEFGSKGIELDDHDARAAAKMRVLASEKYLAFAQLHSRHQEVTKYIPIGDIYDNGK